MRFLFQWAVLTCGHCFCNECISIIIEQYSVGSHRSSIKCAICRQNTSHKEISYVFTSDKASQEEDIPVKVKVEVKNIEKPSQSNIIGISFWQWEHHNQNRLAQWISRKHCRVSVDALPESLSFTGSPSLVEGIQSRSLWQKVTY